MAKYGYGVDVGGTTVKMGLFRADGTLLEKWSIDTDASDGGGNIPADIARSVLDNQTRNRLPREDVLGIGLGIPGQTFKDGTADAVNLNWHRAPIITNLQELTGLRVVFGNDANMAALGEYWVGSGKEYESLILVTLGTGVGGGIILDGKCLEGAHGAGGEIGHIHVEPQETQPCNCGSHGCLEQYASGRGAVRLAKKALAKSPEPSILRDVEKLDAKAIWDAAKDEDKLAMEIAEQYSDYLARGLATVCNTVDPEVILLGGGVSLAGKPLLDRVSKYYRHYAFPACMDTEIHLASLGNDAGIYGCMCHLL